MTDRREIFSVAQALGSDVPTANGNMEWQIFMRSMPMPKIAITNRYLSPLHTII